MISGVDCDGDDWIDGKVMVCEFILECSVLIMLCFVFGQSQVFEFVLVQVGMLVEQCFDFGVGCGDVCVDGGQVYVIVYSLGYVVMLVGMVVFEDVNGCEVVCVGILVMDVFFDLVFKIIIVVLFLLVVKCVGLWVWVMLFDGGVEVIQFNNVVLVE